MGRRIFTATMVGAALLLVAAPASAKGIASAHYTGPGLPPGGITIRGDHPEVFQTGIVEQVRNAWTPTRLGISRAELGPAYSVTFVLEIGRHWRLHQTFYPYATEGGVWSYTPPGQRFGPSGGPIPAGWFSVANTELLRFFIAHGFPAHPPVRAVSATAPETSSLRAAVLWGVVGFASMLGLLGLNVRRRRSSGSPVR